MKSKKLVRSQPSARITAADTFVTIVINGQKWTFSSDGKETFVYAPQHDDAWFVDDPSDLPTRSIDVSLEINKDSTVPPVESSNTSTVASTDSTTNKILQALAEDALANPTQSNQERAEASRRVARQVFGKASTRNILRVAGVRSHLTRGSYGFSLEDLVKSKSVGE